MAFPKYLAVFIALVAVFNISNAQGLKLGFYRKTCPSVEAIVKKTTARVISRAPTLAAPLLRLHFHDCFVRVMLYHIHIKIDKNFSLSLDL